MLHSAGPSARIGPHRACPTAAFPKNGLCYRALRLPGNTQLRSSVGAIVGRRTTTVTHAASALESVDFIGLKTDVDGDGICDVEWCASIGLTHQSCTSSPEDQPKLQQAMRTAPSCIFNVCNTDWGLCRLFVAGCPSGHLSATYRLRLWRLVCICSRLASGAHDMHTRSCRNHWMLRSTIAQRGTALNLTAARVSAF